VIPACSDCSCPDEAQDSHPRSGHKANTEIREFAVTVDGKPAGHYHMEIERGKNGNLVMSARAYVHVRYLVYNYTYSYRGTEEYRHDQLVRFRSWANDDGKQFAVSAGPGAGGLHVTVNGRERVTRPDVWTTSYWQLPARMNKDRSVLLLDADTGKEIHGRLCYLGHDQVRVADRRRLCAHYRVTGPPEPVDLWYDGQHRLVHQDYVDDGHRTILELTRLDPSH
jgi:hypothetical protein